MPSPKMDKSSYSKIKTKIPPLSGVYIFKSAGGHSLYVGKSSNLSNRLKSYFAGAKTPMIAQMIEKASSIKWQTTLTEIEALILESQLIKKLKPPYNTLLRDDKQYFYVGFTRETFPRIIVGHQIPKLKTENYKLKTSAVGPFTDGGALRLALKNLRKIFPYCSCSQKHIRPCLNYHIGNCLGYCCLKDNTFERPFKSIVFYKNNIRAIGQILSGKKTALVQKMIQELKLREISADFELANKLRTQIVKLERFFQNTKIIKNLGLNRKTLLDLKKILGLKNLPKRIEGYDISNIGGLFATGAMIVFTDGLPDKNEYRKFKIKTVSDTNDTGMLREVLERRLRHNEWQYPDLILVDGGMAQVSAMSSVLKNLEAETPPQAILLTANRRGGLGAGQAWKLKSIPPVIGITKDKRHRGERLTLETKKELPLSSLPDPVKNLLLQIDSEAHRFAISYYRKRHSFK